MKKSPFGLFIVLLLISVGLFMADRNNLLVFIRRPLETVLIPVQRATYTFSSAVLEKMVSITTTFQKDETIRNLLAEKAELLQKLVDYEKSRQENDLLKNQLKVRTTSGAPLIEANVIGRGDFMILDKGTRDGVSLGSIAVVQDMLVGRVYQVLENYSRVMPLISSHSNIKARTVNSGATGIVKGDLGNIIFDNVTLEDTLQIGDLVVTSGDVGEESTGFPPDLLIGRIVSVEKNESSLFQKAKIESPLPVSSINMVFLTPAFK